MFGRTLAQLIPPILTKRMIDEVITPRQNFSLLIWLVGGLAAVGLFTAATEAASGWLAAWLGAHIIAFVRAELFRCLERLSLRFHDRKETGSLMSGESTIVEIGITSSPQTARGIYGYSILVCTSQPCAEQSPGLYSSTRMGFRIV